jgi:hypothetical protein
VVRAARVTALRRAAVRIARAVAAPRQVVVVAVVPPPDAAAAVHAVLVDAAADPVGVAAKAEAVARRAMHEPC